MIEKANIFRQMRDTKPLIRAGIMVAEYHLSNDHFSPPPRVSVKAGCFWGSVLTHLRLATSCVCGKFLPSEWGWHTELYNYAELCVKMGLLPAPCVLWTVYLSLWPHHQSLCPPAHQHVEGNYRPWETSQKLPSYYGCVTNQRTICCGSGI